MIVCTFNIVNRINIVRIIKGICKAAYNWLMGFIKQLIQSLAPYLMKSRMTIRKLCTRNYKIHATHNMYISYLHKYKCMYSHIFPQKKTETKKSLAKICRGYCVPDLEFVLIVHGQDLLIVALATAIGIPHAACRTSFLLHHRVW